MAIIKNFIGNRYDEQISSTENKLKEVKNLVEKKVKDDAVKFAKIDKRIKDADKYEKLQNAENKFFRDEIIKLTQRQDILEKRLNWTRVVSIALFASILVSMIAIIVLFMVIYA